VTVCAAHADSDAPSHPGRQESPVREYSGAPAG
jgi:hypothetical protein